MKLTGPQGSNCNTDNLDNEDKTDFSPYQNGEFWYEYDWFGWNCYLDGQVNAAVVSWEGSGTWTLNSICFDWTDANANVWKCSGDGSSLSAKQEMALTCKEEKSKTCD